MNANQFENWIPITPAQGNSGWNIQVPRRAAGDQELGGKITHAAMDILTIGRIVMVADSQGAEFTMIKPAMMA